MKIRYISDLHLEFSGSIEPRQIPPGKDEVLILAGDIGQSHLEKTKMFFRYVSQNFMKVFYVPGNHEYYGSNTIEKTRELLSQLVSEYPNISLLDRGMEIYQNYIFIGTTMWSLMKDFRYKVNDFYSIPGMNIPRYNEENRKDVEFLETQIKIKPGFDGYKGKIVITHHIPSKSLTDGQYEGSPYNQCFFTDMDHVSGQEDVRAWFFGHTHLPSQTGKFYCNPIGYPGENSFSIPEALVKTVEL